MSALIRGAEAPPGAIHDGVRRAAAAHPDRIAVRCGPRQVSYRELLAQADRVAAALWQRGVRPGALIPVAARRSVELPAVLLGVLMTGAAYGLLDVRWPEARVESLIAAMHPPLVAADPAGAKLCAEAGIEHVSFADLLAHPAYESGSGAADLARMMPAVSPDAASTLFWTSGSTGRPKGVLSTHQATTRLFGDHPCTPFGEAPVMANAAAVPWDAFTLELWGMLLHGGTVLVHEDDLLLPANLRDYIRVQGMTHLFLTPSLFDMLVQADLDCLAGISVLILGGDKPSAASCAKFLAAFPRTELYNGYGPVESCVFASTWRITPEDVAPGAAGGVPIGRPVAGTGLCIVDEGRSVPCGRLGEIAISGAGLALGYLDDPERTAQSFRTVVVDGEQVRVYLTGDQGRLDADGVLHFAGRRDNQFKIAGHRIEAGEVEAAARSAGCAQALALPLRVAGVDKLVLFAVLDRSAEAVDAASADAAGADGGEFALRSALAQTLPAYMVPSRIHLVESFPLLENTKIDRRRLTEAHGYQYTNTSGTAQPSRQGGEGRP
jgi:amino acid adenylation domain-containing protein